MSRRRARIVRLSVALAASLLELLLVTSLVLAALRGAGSQDDDTLMSRATWASGWFYQSLIATALGVGLIWIWRWVGRPDREAAWLAGERPVPDEDHDPHHGLSGDWDPPSRW